VKDDDCEKSSQIVFTVASRSDASMDRSGDDCTDEKSRIMSLVMCNAKEPGVAARHMHPEFSRITCRSELHHWVAT
jgi:hypothetical protein